MPFNGDFYTNDKDLAPTYDFYTEGMKQKGTLPGSWQMRQAYAGGQTQSQGSNPSSPGFVSSYSRDINTTGSAPYTQYSASSPSGTMRAPQGDATYGPGSEEATATNFFGKMGKLKNTKNKKEPGERSPKSSGPDDNGGSGMPSQQSGNTSNSKSNTKAKNMSQSANVNQGGNQNVAGGDVSFSGDFNQSNINAGGNVLGRGARVQTFTFDPNHPFFNGGPGPKPPTGGPDLPPPQGPPQGPTPQPPTNPPGGPTPEIPTPESPEPKPNGSFLGAPRGGGGPAAVFPGNKGPAPEPKPNGSFLGAPRGGGGPAAVFPGNKGPAPEPKPNGSFLGAPRNVGNVPPAVFPGSPGPSKTPGTALELYKGGPPAVSTPDGGAVPPTGQTPTTGLPDKKGPGFFGRLRDRAVDKIGDFIFKGVDFGPGPEGVNPENAAWMAEHRGLPSGAPTTGLPSGGSPIAAIGPGSNPFTGYNLAAATQAQRMGINLQTGVNYGLGQSDLARMTSGNSANNGSPASTPIGNQNPRYGVSGMPSFNGRGPQRPTAKVGRYGETPAQPSSPRVNPNNPNNLDMYTLTAMQGAAGMPGVGSGVSMPQPAGPQPTRHDINPNTGNVRPDFGQPRTGMSRHPKPPARPTWDANPGGYAGVATAGKRIADSELARQAFRQRSRRPGT